jgi:glycosyltransferase involved in cell wall biosynthesis
MTLFIEAFNIHTGGAKNLLEYLVKFLADKNNDEVYISLKNKSLINYVLKYPQFKLLPSETLAIIKRFAYRSCNVLYFGNIPPLHKSKKSLLYIHNEYLTLTTSEILTYRISIRSKVKLLIQNLIISLLHKNVPYIAVQTRHMADKLSQKLKREILIIPFFEEGLLPDLSLKKVFDFCYVGLPSKHKNHDVLLKSIKQLLQKEIRVKVALTVPYYVENSFLLDEIETINSVLPGCIHNYGLADKKTINEIYSKSRALIFPSKKESLGLPIIEALQHNLTILSSDLEFSYDIIENPITIDPDNPEHIERIMIDFLEGKFNSVKQSLKIKSEIEKIIEIIST